VLGAIDIGDDGLDDIEPAGGAELDGELPLDVHAVVASARATTALPMVTVALRNGMGKPLTN
jgi:hypothetical protein